MAVPIALLVGGISGVGLLGLGGYLLYAHSKSLSPAQQQAVSTALASTNPQGVANVADALDAAGHTEAATAVGGHAQALSDATSIPIVKARPSAPVWTAANEQSRLAHVRKRAEMLLAQKQRMRPAPPPGRPAPPAGRPAPTAPGGPRAPVGGNPVTAMAEKAATGLISQGANVVASDVSSGLSSLLGS